MAARPKGKRRNSEKRKEKSRDAARSRRGREAEVFDSLGLLLPLSQGTTSQMDKASVMRLCISHLKLRKLLGYAKDKPQPPEDPQDKDLDRRLDQLYPKALNGFILILAKEGDIVFLSDSVKEHLGLTQIEMLGHSVYDFTHPCDHDEIKEMLQERPHHTTAGGSTEERSFFMRLKCTLTSKGRNINLKSASYKVLQCSGRYLGESAQGQYIRGLGQDMPIMVLIAEPIPHPSNIECPLDAHTFLSRHTMDMKFTFCDDRIQDLLGYQGDQLMDKCFYDYHHALDAEMIEKAYKTLFSKGQTVTDKYRFLANGGGYAWVETQATVIYNPRTDKPQCVVCVHSVISAVECGDTVLSDVQMAAPKPMTVPSDIKPVTLPSGITLSTESMFAPRPKDINLDMFKPTDTSDTSEMMQALMQLAPSAGDVMTSLDFGTNDEPETLVEDGMFPLSGGGADRNLGGPQAFDLGFGPSLRVCPPTMLPVRVDEHRVPDTDYMSSDSRPLSQTSANMSINDKNGGFDDMEDFDYDLRAPFIPMDTPDDQLYNMTLPIPLMDDDGPSEMLGITETVFAPRPPELDYGNNNANKKHTPLSVLRLQANQKLPSGPVGDIARNAGPPIMKRPMEMNRLETGPPVKKAATLLGDGRMMGKVLPIARATWPSASATITRPPKETTGGSTGSVLMNLLVKGEDVNYGYRIRENENIVNLDPSDESDDSLSDPSENTPSLCTLRSLLGSDNETSPPSLQTTTLCDTIMPTVPRRIITTAPGTIGYRQGNLVLIQAPNNTVLVAPISNKGGTVQLI